MSEGEGLDDCKEQKEKEDKGGQENGDVGAEVGDLDQFFVQLVVACRVSLVVFRPELS